MKLETIYTCRLIGRYLRQRDFVEACTLLQDPEITRTITDTGTPFPEEVIYARLMMNEEHWAQYGFGLWSLHEATTGELIGQGGLRTQKIDGKIEVDLGCAIASKYWNKGYASEITLKWIEIGFKELELPSIVALARPTNGGFRRVLEKCGLTYEKEVHYHGTPHALYRILNGNQPSQDQTESLAIDAHLSHDAPLLHDVSLPLDHK